MSNCETLIAPPEPTATDAARPKESRSRRRRPKRGYGEPAAVEVLKVFLDVVGPALSKGARREIAGRLLRRTRRTERADDITIGRLCKLYKRHAADYYRGLDGLETSEATCIDHAMRPLRKLFARTRVSDFGPRKLAKVRERMIEMDWCRRHINHQVGRIKRMFKWAVENEIIPAESGHAIQAVQGLRAGRTRARESVPVKPVPEPWIEAVLAVTSSQVKAMIQLQLLTAMRPGEVCIMRTCDIDTTVQPWVYRPEHHKTEHHDHERLVFLGPKAQEVVRPFLDSERPWQYLFSPAAADRLRRQRLHAARKTPLSCGNRPGTNRRAHPRRSPGDRYDTGSYRRAITYACLKALPVPDGLDRPQADQWRREHNWHPHQLRHNAATWLRRDFGIDVAQVVLGHKTLAVTQVYAEKNVESAQRVMLQVG